MARQIISHSLSTNSKKRRESKRWIVRSLVGIAVLLFFFLLCYVYAIVIENILPLDNHASMDNGINFNMNTSAMKNRPIESKEDRRPETHSVPMDPLKPLKFITVVLPSVVNPTGREKRLDAITSTWGPASNAIYVTHPGTSSDYTLANANASKDSFPRIMPIEPNIALEDEGVPRLKHVISEIYKRYNPDFAFFANDHTFIIPQHLCSFLKEHSFQAEEHLYAGHALRPKNQKGTKYAFNSGASGYFLSRKTMQVLTEKWNEGDTVCEGSGRKWLQGNPGLITAECLKSVGVDPLDTRDESKRHIFHAFGLVRVVKKELDQWYEDKHVELYEILGNDETFHHELQKGKDCCSPGTASFHYVEWAETLALWGTLAEILKRGINGIEDKELQKYMIDHWPKEKKDVGGYAQHLPPVSKQDVWNDLLYIVKSIAPTNEDGFC